MKPGDIIYIWHNSGAMGAQQWLGKVVRVNRKTVTCLMEYRTKTARIPKQDINVASAELAKEYGNE